MSKTRAHVQPTKALLLFSAPCEQQAAYIRNQAIDAIEDNDMIGICKRFNQSSRAQGNALFLATAMLIGFIWELKCINDINGWIEKVDPQNNQPSYTKSFFMLLQLGLLAMSIYSFVRVPTGFSNFNRYRGTKNMCLDWLNNHLDKKTIAEIANVPSEQIDSYLIKKFS